VEAVYRSVHPRLWRSLLSYTGDAELASDAEAEAFAQVLRRGDAVDDVAAWVWRSAFRIASGLLATRSVLDQLTVPDTWSRVLDHVPVRDTWSRVQFTEEVVTMIDLETPVPTETRQKGPMRVLVAGILAAAAVVAIALVATRDGDVVEPTDEPSPAVTAAVTPAPPPRALFGTPGERLVPGTYFVDEVDGTPTARILVTIGAGWTNTADNWGVGKEDIGFITFSRPTPCTQTPATRAMGITRGP